MERSMIEISPDGDIRVVSVQPPKRPFWRKRRRAWPAHWTETEIAEGFQVGFTSGDESGSYKGAFVAHYPEEWFPKDLVRRTKESIGTWLAFEWWGFAWDEQAWTSVKMETTRTTSLKRFGAGRAWRRHWRAHKNLLARTRVRMTGSRSLSQRGNSFSTQFAASLSTGESATSPDRA